MQLITFSKKIILGAILTICTLSAFAQVAVPVVDQAQITANTTNTRLLEDAIKASAKVISASADNNNDVVTKLMSEINRQSAERETLRYLAEEKRRNAERHSVMYGAKVKDACALVKGSREVQRGQISRQKIENNSVVAADIYLNRGKYRSVNESATVAEGSSVLSKLNKINDFKKANNKLRSSSALVDPSLSLSTERNDSGVSEYSAEFERKMVLLNPFADAVAPNYDDPKQPASLIANSAHSKWKQEMYLDVAANISFLMSNKATAFSDQWASSLFSSGADGVQMKALAMGENGQKGYYATLQAVNRARAFNADWIAYTNNSMTDKAMRVDANYMSAQMLVNQQEIIRLLIMIAENQHTSISNDMRYYWGGDDSSTAPH